MIIRPAHSYPCTYKGSSSEIEFECMAHEGRLVCGSARRTGLTVVEEWPVYALHSFIHPEYNDILVALTPNGFRIRPIYTIREQEPHPNRTPFIACVLEESGVPYDFDPHPAAWWMYTKGDLVRAVNKQVSGIRYVTPEQFQAAVTLTGHQGHEATPDHWQEAFERAGLADASVTGYDEQGVLTTAPLVQAIPGDPRNFLGVTHWVAYFYQQSHWDVFTGEGNGLKIFLRAEEADSFVEHYIRWWREQAFLKGKKNIVLHQREPAFQELPTHLVLLDDGETPI